MFIFFWSKALYDILMSSSLPSSARRTSFQCSSVNKVTLSHLFVLDELFTCTDFHFMISLPSSSYGCWASDLPAPALQELITFLPLLLKSSSPASPCIWWAPHLPFLVFDELLTCQDFAWWTPHLPALVSDELLTCQPWFMMSFLPVSPCIWWASHLPAIVIYELLTCQALYLMSSLSLSVM